MDGRDGGSAAVGSTARLLAAVARGVPDMLVDLRKHLYELEPTYAEFLDGRDEEMLAAAQAGLSIVVTRALATRDEAERSGPTRPGASGTAASGTAASGTVASGTAAGDDSDTLVDEDFFADIGRAQWRLGMSVGTLLSAYRLGARIAWRHLAAAAVEAGAEPSTLASLAESVFSSVDQLSSASTSGYLDEQANASAARQRSRDALVDLLLSGRADDAALAAAARQASWPVPPTAAVILVDDAEDGPDGSGAARHPGAGHGPSPTPPAPDWLAVRWAGRRGYIVPSASQPAVRALLRRVLVGRRAVVGWDGATHDLTVSLRGAEIAARLRADGALGDDPVFVDEHLDALVVHREPGLLGALRNQVLAPLDDAAPGSRPALYETLRAYFRHFGDRRAMAAELHVHVQTIRYRLDRLHALFGDALSDPDGRLRILLAVAWERDDLA